MRLSTSVLLGVPSAVLAHGRLMEPPGRSSLYQFPGDVDIAAGWDRIVPNYNDHELFCGGFAVQVSNGYKCGVCGDNFLQPRPRNNELGGKYGSSGIIPRSYQAGDIIPLAVQITAHHLGYFEFRLCQYDGGLEDDQCFISDESLLTFTDGSTRYYITSQFPLRPGKMGYWYELEAHLPDIECEHCVLQWRYHCGNNWGSDDEGTGMGFGLQEEFYGCADIKITSDGGKPIKPTTIAPTTVKQTTSSDDTTTQQQSTKVTTTRMPLPDSPLYCTGKSDGLYKHGECDKFYQCVNGRTYERPCPAGLRFNAKHGFCDWATNVQC